MPLCAALCSLLLGGVLEVLDCGAALGSVLEVLDCGAALDAISLLLLLVSELLIELLPGVLEALVLGAAAADC